MFYDFCGGGSEVRRNTKYMAARHQMDGASGILAGEEQDMTEPVKGCPQPGPPELVMRADGYHYQEDEMKDKTVGRKPTESSLMLAAQAWCEPETSSIEMDVHLATAFARILDRALNAPADRDAMRKAVTEEMVTAYLTANAEYWRETDAQPHSNPSKWRNGTPSEATRVSLEAALAAAPAPSTEQQGEQEPAAWAATSEAGVVEALGMNQSRRFDTPLYTRPSPSLAELRAAVEALENRDYPDRQSTVCKDAVLALIDKMGGKV